MAALLRQGGKLEGFSRAMTLAALLSLALDPGPLELRSASAFAGASLLGAFACVLAVRVGLDADLFEEASRSGWQDIDGALVGLSLAPRSQDGRSTRSRMAGAFRLLRLLGAAVGLQLLLLLLGCLLRAWSD